MATTATTLLARAERFREVLVKARDAGDVALAGAAALTDYAPATPAGEDLNRQVHAACLYLSRCWSGVPTEVVSDDDLDEIVELAGAVARAAASDGDA